MIIENPDYQQGIQAAQMGDLQTAVAALQRVIAGDPDHIEARYKLGWALGSLGFLDPALREFEQVLQRDPQHREAAYNMGAILLQKAQLESEQPGTLDPQLLEQSAQYFEKVMAVDAFDQKAFAMLNLVKRALRETLAQSEKADQTLQ